MRSIIVTSEEAMLIDWVLTLHDYNESLFEKLREDWVYITRKKIASIILSDKDTSLILTEDELSYLLMVVPITFRFSKNDIGFSLKKKLLSLIIPPKPLDLSSLDELKEVKDAENENPSEDIAEDIAAYFP